MSPSSLRSWTCDTCKGLAAEIASLGDSVPSPALVAIEDGIKTGSPGTRRCPKCAIPMARVPIRAGHRRFEIDGCGPCRIAWFDRGELSSLRHRRPRASAPKLSSMTPEERHAWRMEELRKEGYEADQESSAAMLAIVLGIPLPEPVRGFKGRPLVTWGICLVTLATSIAAWSNFPDNAVRFGMVPEKIFDGHWWGLGTHFFLHADPFHLLGNLVFLFVFGSRVEALVGAARYLVLIAVATLAGALLHAYAAPNSEIPLIGASGGISGVLAAHACLRPHAKVRTMIAYRVVAIPASVMFAIWVVLQIIGTAAQMSGTSAVSALGHLGGAIAGFLLSLLWKARARTIEPACA
jgi:membrane associated rhomboid family serine protease